jgi:hypothetical protein
MLLLNGTSNLCGLAEEIKIFPNPAGAGVMAPSKGIIVERIIGLIELITESIVRVFEFECVISLLATSG